MAIKKKKIKFVNFQVVRGIRINGESLFPAEKKSGAKKEPEPVVIRIRETLARELEAASKGVITEAPPNKDIRVEKSEDDDSDLDEIFGTDGDTDGDGEE